MPGQANLTLLGYPQKNRDSGSISALDFYQNEGRIHMNRKTDGNPAMARAIDHDQIFKNLIKNFFKEFMELFLPDAAKAINFRRITFLEKEYFTDASGGKRKQMDLVVRAGLKGGGEEFILVHTEFESSRKNIFPERMCEYFFQLYLRHKKPIIPIAVFADDQKWKKPLPDTYEIGFKGEVYNKFRYRQIKLKNLDYRKFLRTKNPLAYALMAKMGYSRKQMIQAKSDFWRLIAGARKVNPARRHLLIEFVETYMQLNRQEQKRFDKIINEQKEYQEAKKMITVYEKRGKQEGLLEGKQEGLIEGKQDDLLLLMEKKFGKLSQSIKNKIRKINSVKKLDSLLVDLLDAGKLTDLKL